MGTRTKADGGRGAPLDGRTGVPDAFKDYAVLSKPFAMKDLERTLRLALWQPC
jgi:hypothetical protein